MTPFMQYLRSLKSCYILANSYQKLYHHKETTLTEDGRGIIETTDN